MQTQCLCSKYTIHTLCVYTITYTLFLSQYVFKCLIQISEVGPWSTTVCLCAVFGLRSPVVRYPPVAWPRHLLRFIKSLLERRGVHTSDRVQSHLSRSALTSRGVSRSATLTGTAAAKLRLVSATIASPPVGHVSRADCRDEGDVAEPRGGYWHSEEALGLRHF